MHLKPDDGDLSTSEFLDEGTIVEKLCKRFFSGEYYTYIGEIIVAVNPCQPIKIYEAEDHERYKNLYERRTQKPHIYWMADEVYRCLRETSQNQCIIVSGQIQSFILEKCRLIHRQKNEKNFHIFYALLGGLEPELKEKFYLGEAAEYRIVQGEDEMAPVFDNNEDYNNYIHKFASLEEALQKIGFDNLEVTDMYNVLSAVLNLTNINFEVDEEAEDGEIDVPNESKLIISNGSREPSNTPGRRSLRSFDKKILIRERTSRKSPSISLLDISGFEKLSVNGFEQLLINTANEVLHQIFLTNVIRREQEEYEKEGIHWKDIQFHDNKDVIDLILKISNLKSFQKSLRQLQTKLNQSKLLFVRCLKPNTHLKPNKFDHRCMQQQLRASGLTEAANIRKDGYPIRLPFAKFSKRYGHLLKYDLQDQLIEPQKKCEMIINEVKLQNCGIGKTKVMLKYQDKDILENRLKEHEDRNFGTNVSNIAASTRSSFSSNGPIQDNRVNLLKHKLGVKLSTEQSKDINISKTPERNVMDDESFSKDEGGVPSYDFFRETEREIDNEIDFFNKLLKLLRILFYLFTISGILVTGVVNRISLQLMATAKPPHSSDSSDHPWAEKCDEDSKAFLICFHHQILLEDIALNILFVLPHYEPIFPDMGLLLRRRQDVKEKSFRIKKEGLDENNMRPKILICATTWHETRQEMLQLQKSLFRLDLEQVTKKLAQSYVTSYIDVNSYELEIHVIFDDAWETDSNHNRVPNGYVREFVDLIPEAAESVAKGFIRLNDFKKVSTPYGGRLELVMPGDTQMIIHLKDKDKIRHKKRWSQIEKTFILTLDGDVDFKPNSVKLLIDRMLKNSKVGAVCGRIHPVGSGEDRWLCTLLLQQGYKIDYCAGADAFTFAPESFHDFFIQRRRWAPSTIANIMDLLSTWRVTVSLNDNISALFILYQFILMTSSILAPATVILMIAGSYSAVLKLSMWKSFALSLVPVIIFIVVCLKAKTSTQITFAAFMTSVYTVVMVVVTVGTLVNILDEDLISPNVVFLAGLAIIFSVCGLLHPREIVCLIHGILYFLTVPSSFIFLTVYFLCNLNNVSWGTRENPKVSDEESVKKANDDKKKTIFSLFNLNSLRPIIEDFKKFIYDILGKKPGESAETRGFDPVTDVENQKPTTQLQSIQAGVKVIRTKIPDDLHLKVDPFYWRKLAYLGNGEECCVNDDEVKFWNYILRKYLYPLKEDKDEKERIKRDLDTTRNNVVFGYFLLNLLWSVAVMQLQTMKHELLPFFILKKYEPISVIFLTVFGLVLTFQFVGMCMHRWGTFLHLMSTTHILSNEVEKNRMIENVIRSMASASRDIDIQPDYSSDEEDSVYEGQLPEEDYPIDDSMEEEPPKSVYERIYHDRWKTIRRDFNKRVPKNRRAISSGKKMRK
ncbi:chitin synthase chs-2-like [Octopus vulgaris]|uniref:chitin synthase n=1 Tax=Octopus vulgaris TaxID=6645 RepID=A0AA36BI49_OCTVU|nr:chitin synthase chs-2-like [Octopus vulgaris]